MDNYMVLFTVEYLLLALMLSAALEIVKRILQSIGKKLPDKIKKIFKAIKIDLIYGSLFLGSWVMIEHMKLTRNFIADNKYVTIFWIGFLSSIVYNIGVYRLWDWAKNIVDQKIGRRG